MSGRGCVLVLGAGRVGSLIAADRSREALTAVALGTAIQIRQLDVADPAAVRELAGEADVVVGAVPGALGVRRLP